MDNIVTPEIARLFEAKASRRRQLASLSYPEKVRALVKLQEMAAPVLRQRGCDVHPWSLAAVPVSK